MILFISPLAIVALSNPVPNLDRAVVVPEAPLAIAETTLAKSLPVPALTFNAVSNACWLRVTDPVAFNSV